MFEILTLVYRVLMVYIEVCIDLFRAKEKKNVKGQNVLITGSGHGLGLELAIKFARLGANVIIVDLNIESAEAAEKEVTKNFSVANQKVLTYAVDVREESQIADLAERVKRDLGDVDILINNAGIVQCLPYDQLSPIMVERTFQVNVMSHIWAARQFLPSMIKKGRGHIVATSSIAGLIGSKYLTDYCASKFAVVGFMDSLDKEVHDGGANENIHFTTVCPASMSTGMFQSFTSKFIWLIPVLSPEQVASRILDTILLNQKFVVVPYITWLFYRLSFILPTKVSVLVQEYLDYGVKPHRK